MGELYDILLEDSILTTNCVSKIWYNVMISLVVMMISFLIIFRHIFSRRLPNLCQMWKWSCVLYGHPMFSSTNPFFCSNILYNYQKKNSSFHFLHHRHWYHNSTLQSLVVSSKTIKTQETKNKSTLWKWGSKRRFTLRIIKPEPAWKSSKNI